MDCSVLSYREIIPDTSSQEDWAEILLNTGGQQSTLMDIKVAEKAGGYCYRHVELNHTRNRFIYWRSYQNVVELSEICLDFNLYQNNLRYKFSDSPVLAVSITEHDRFVTLLVTTVCSLHRISFPHPDTLANGTRLGTSGSVASINFNESQNFSIFRDASATLARDPTSFYVIDAHSGASHHPVPYAANSLYSQASRKAYFALACHTQLTLYVMNCDTGQTVSHLLKVHHLMPRLFSNIKGALTGKSDYSDDEQVTSLVFSSVKDQIYLLALYRNDHLRVWSTSSMQNLCSINCVREGNEQRMQGPQSNALRKISETSFCVFLSHSAGAEFVCIDLLIDMDTSNAVTLLRRKVISAPQLDLADFDASPSRIWALWSNAEGEFSVSNFALCRGMGMNWMSAAMEPPPDRYCVGIEQGADPREAYCAYIFHPGKFERDVIAKALFMFRRSNVRFDTKHCTMNMLREHVCQAVEDEIENEIKEFEVTDEEYLEIATRLWERFYSCCEQYHMKACQPTGLVILEPIDGICVVKKSTFSMLRPCETLEHLMLVGNDVDMGVVVPIHFQGNECVGEDLVSLVIIIAQLEKWLPEDVKIDLDHKLYQLEMPIVLISKLTDDILTGDPNKEILPPNFLLWIRQKLKDIRNLETAMRLLLGILCMDHGNPEAMQAHLNVATSNQFLAAIGTLFGSQLGLSLLTETIRQTAMIRFAICRNLLILQQILIDTFTLDVNVAETVRSHFIPDTVTFLQCYYVMVWACETSVNLASISALETSIQRLNILQLVNGFGRIYSNGGKSQFVPLLRVFLNAKGLYTSLVLYASSINTLQSPVWHNTLMPLATIVGQLIWPVSCNFVFGEWLLGTCQHIIIEDYARLLSNWCEWNICSRQFILAVSLLDCGETQKAYDLFLQSAKGVLKEQFLSDKFLKHTALAEKIEAAMDVNGSVVLTNQAIAQYYLKVIRLFEQHNALDHIISMAQVAIGLLERSDPQLPMFQSIVFNNHLQLNHYEEAYHSLIYNADPSRSKDCLRQLVVTLFTRNRLDLLMQFPYVGLYEEFESIVESRARSLVIEQNKIYDFLYAFYINNGNMRKASAIMYEQAMRLQLESESIESMQKRRDSLLVCINALQLIDTRYRWIAKPIMGEDCSASTATADIQREDMDTEETSLNTLTQQQVVVLEISDIRRELLQTEALIQLSQHRKDVNAFLNVGPQELSFILTTCGLYTDALKLAKGFNITLLPVFESLAAACVHAANEPGDDAWVWLQKNNLTDLPHRNNAVDMAWSLLQKLVEHGDYENATQIRKRVVNKVLSLNAFVPQWLYNDYKLLNCPEMLRLYVNHNRFLEAAELAQEMICAMMGAGSEYFSCRHAVVVTNPEMCLPVNILDLLLHNLKLNAQDDIEYKQAAVELEDIVQKYIKVASSTANDKIQMATLKTIQTRQLAGT